MSVNRDELKAALLAAKKKHVVEINEDLAYLVISKVADKKERMLFVEAIRFSLNELNIWEKEKRQAYSTVIGKYFGRRGGLKRARQMRRPPVPQKPSVTGTTVVEPSGQYAFKL